MGLGICLCPDFSSSKHEKRGAIFVQVDRGERSVVMDVGALWCFGGMGWGGKGGKRVGGDPEKKGKRGDWKWKWSQCLAGGGGSQREREREREREGGWGEGEGVRKRG